MQELETMAVADGHGFSGQVSEPASPECETKRNKRGRARNHRDNRFLFVLWNIKLGSFKSYVYYTHST